MMTLDNGVVIFLVSLGLSIYGLISFRKNGMKDKDVLLTLTKRFSIIPLGVNLFILSLFVVPYMANVVIRIVSIPGYIVIYLFIAGLYASGVSAAVGPAIGLAGIVLSLYNKRAQNKPSIRYIIISVIATLISLGFLAIFLKRLIPYALEHI
ncbi:MAG: hypothetical protein E7574_04970 [Ruminococcaceae bacterium]|nr:hypothetical protein [Oscillospiraceae bacterium]